MTSTAPFKDRITAAAVQRQTKIVAALDLRNGKSPLARSDEKDLALEHSVANLIEQVQASICAIKINLHLLLPLSAKQISEINELAHSHGLVSIADVKLNDIQRTNEIALGHLVNSMGFDCIIANPFIGSASLRSLVRKAHSFRAGVIALVYMSHPGAGEGYGLDIIQGANRSRPLYDIFLDRAISAGADGIVIGATQKAILAELATSGRKHPPIYSPGIGAQGATVDDAVKLGCDFLIIGRSIIESKDPRKKAQQIQARVKRLSMINNGC